MERFLQWIDSIPAPIEWLITAAIGAVVAIPVSRWFERKKRFVFKTQSFRLIEKEQTALKNLEVLYKGRPVQELTVTQFAIWNKSIKTIDKEDVVEELRIESENGDILEVKILSEAEKKNGFAIRETTEKVVTFDFEYVDDKEGVAVQVIHTGSIGSLHLKNKLKGGEPPKELHQKKWWRCFIGVLIMTLVIPLGLSAGAIMSDLDRTGQVSDHALGMMAVLISFGLSGLAMAFWWLGNRFVEREVPDELRRYT